MAFFKIVIAVDIYDVKVTPTGKLPKRERERITEGIEDCLSRAPADRFGIPFTTREGIWEHQLSPIKVRRGGDLRFSPTGTAYE